jgi:1,4-dihydroxy-2-naphthoyl-CoA hydrolase
MTIWHCAPSLDSANERGTGCLNENLGIELVEIGDDHLSGRMPVDGRTHQPAGVLHGGASVALAETLASWAATFAVDRSRFHCVGMEINANHLRPVVSGWVTGVARPVALGRRTHVWGVEIRNDDGKLVCVSRCTLAVLEKPSAYGA